MVFCRLDTSIPLAGIKDASNFQVCSKKNVISIFNTKTIPIFSLYCGWSSEVDGVWSWLRLKVNHFPCAWWDFVTTQLTSVSVAKTIIPNLYIWTICDLFANTPQYPLELWGKSSITDGVHRNENSVEIIPVFSTFSNFSKKKKIIKAILCNFSMRFLKYFQKIKKKIFCPPKHRKTPLKSCS